MDHDRFDDFTRTLATSTSRRHALKMLGGGLLAALVPGSVLAKGGGNSAGAKFCARVFGADTPAAKQCTADAAKGKGLYSTCGADPSSICCTKNGSGYCTSYASASCGCPSPQRCLNNTCQTCIPSDGMSTCTMTEECCGDACINGLCYSCFTAGTRVAMADGTSRPIEHVLVGDLVLGSDGHINRVVEIERPLLGQRRLYALNGSDFFVTAEHPFMTEAGWKSIDPAALGAENSALSVDRLVVGDRLLILTDVAVALSVGSIRGEVVDMRTESVVLTSLVGQPADPATPLYNLRLDGDHTYFANDLLVHNK